MAKEKKKVLKNIGKSIKNVAVKTSQGVKKVTAATAAKAKKVIDKGKDAAMMALFIPFAPLARIFLKRRGVAPAKDLRALALQVHNERTKKSFGLVPGGDAFDYGLTTAEEFGYLDGLGVEHANFGFIPVTPDMIMGVISFLKSVFQTIKDKKARGEKLSADEQAIADQADSIEAALGAAKDQAGSIANESESKADSILTGGNAWKIALAVLLLIVLIVWLRSR